MGEVKDPIAKVDMVITHISDGILELDSSHSGNGVPELATALAVLLNARTMALADNKARKA